MRALRVQLLFRRGNQEDVLSLKVTVGRTALSIFSFSFSLYTFKRLL